MPFVLPTLSTVAIAVLPEVHVTSRVMFLVEPSENVPVAVIGSAVPAMMLGVVGVTVIATSVALEMVSIAVASSPLVESNAVIVTVPGATPVAMPLLKF
jgi:hypothetical protein